jgi:flagellar biogenesis protein FliO
MWPIAGAAFVGIAAVTSYVYATPTPEARVVVGIVAVVGLVIVAVLLLERFAESRTKP